MSAKWEKQEGNIGVLTIEVDVETFNKGLDEAFKKIAKTINVPGFRKGKITRKFFEQRFGVESLYQEALDKILPNAYMKAVVETEIEPVDQPEVDIQQMKKGEPLVFTAKVTVKPEFELGTYKGLKAKELDTVVTDEDIVEELKRMQEGHADLVVKEDGVVEEGDTAVIDFEGFVDDVAFEGGKGTNYSLVIGSNTFIPGFEDQLIGLKAGESKDVVVTFPEEYHASDLAGKEAVFKCTVHEIKTKELPELNDDFVAELNQEGIDTLDQLKEDIKKRLEEQKKHEAEVALHDSLIDQIIENTSIDLPEAMITTEVDRMIQEFEQRLGSQGMNLELYYQYTGGNEESLRIQMKDEGTRRVQTRLILEAIAKAENIEATEDDVHEEFSKVAEQTGMPIEQIRTLIQDVAAVKKDIVLRKAIEFLVENKK
ncbi:MAG TPA: trigger factor [Firmicutes bacterium]|nr:trigger factor [Bacillales bacterium]HJA42191.1 trigger factor [Bacillota bacterium]